MNTNIPDMLKPDQPARFTRLQYYDGSERNVYVTQKTFPYPAGQLIISRVDLDGILTHVNDAFVILSGYSKAELIGQPHCIIRHPDMPKAAFKELWETVKSGKKWYGYVKNLRKDGGHYWVYATVVPNYRDGKIEGYTSVRRQASTHHIAQAEARYKAMRAEEKAS